MSKFIGFVTHEQVDSITGKTERVVFDSYQGAKKEIKAWYSKMQANAHLHMKEVNAQSFQLSVEKY